jgi:hypothetical protein
MPRPFLKIWIVEVEGRLFARSWDLSERSWFTAFLEEGVGVIKCGDEEIEVSGRKVENAPLLQEKISAAYLAKYTTEENKPYAIGISRPQHLEATMEFLPLNS